MNILSKLSSSANNNCFFASWDPFILYIFEELTLFIRNSYKLRISGCYSRQNLKNSIRKIKEAAI